LRFLPLRDAPAGLGFGGLYGVLQIAQGRFAMARKTNDTPRQTTLQNKKDQLSLALGVQKMEAAEQARS
jgi:hypothetical protein